MPMRYCAWPILDTNQPRTGEYRPFDCAHFAFFFIAFSLAQIILNGLKLLSTKPRRRRIVALIGGSAVD